MACKLVWNNRILYISRINAVSILVQLLNVRTHFVEDSQRNGNVADIGYIFKHAGTVSQYNSGNYRHNSVLSTAYYDLALESSAAFYNKLFQS